jgi:hypothetical protein
MSYVLATTEDVVRFYYYDLPIISGREPKLDRVLDLSKVTLLGDKETAKRTALALGLKTWRYVRI